MEVSDRRSQEILGSCPTKGRCGNLRASKYNSDVRGSPGLLLEGVTIDLGGREVVQC